MTAADLLNRLAIPILQAPMLGAAGMEMALAVSRAGGLGALAVAGLTPTEIADQIAELRTGGGAFSVNLFVLRPVTPSQEEVARAIDRLAPWYARLGLEPPSAPASFAPDFAAQLEAVRSAAPPMASFTFGILTRAEAAALQAVGTLVMGTATTVAEARAWAAVGADVICAQGAEAGGHRGEFLNPGPASLIGTMALVSSIRAAVDLPVVAAGGIMDGRGVAAALALGAAAVQMGTAFLLAEEATVSPAWRARVAAPGDDATAVTRAITGRNARGIETELMRTLRPVEAEVPAYPVQNRLTRDLRAEAAKAGDSELLSLWAGQGVALARPGRAGELIRAWWREAGEVSDQLSARTHGRSRDSR